MPGAADILMKESKRAPNYPRSAGGAAADDSWVADRDVSLYAQGPVNEPLPVWRPQGRSTDDKGQKRTLLRCSRPT
jgi:hypothetical protein